jgi:hypothetical protein
MFKRRSSTNPFTYVISKTTIFLALPLAIFLLWIQASRKVDIPAPEIVAFAQDSPSNLVESDHYLYSATTP